MIKKNFSKKHYKLKHVSNKKFRITKIKNSKPLISLKNIVIISKKSLNFR